MCVCIDVLEIFEEQVHRESPFSFLTCVIITITIWDHEGPFLVIMTRSLSLCAFFMRISMVFSAENHVVVIEFSLSSLGMFRQVDSSIRPPSSHRLIWSSSWLHKRKKRCSEFKYLMQQKRMKARKKYECQRSELHNVKHTHCEEEEKKNTPKTWSHWKCWTWSWFSTEKTQGASWNTPQRSARDAVTFFPSMHNSKNSNSSWLFCFYAQVLVSECNFLKYYTK